MKIEDSMLLESKSNNLDSGNNHSVDSLRISYEGYQSGKFESKPNKSFVQTSATSSKNPLQANQNLNRQSTNQTLNTTFTQKQNKPPQLVFVQAEKINDSRVKNVLYNCKVCKKLAYKFCGNCKQISYCSEHH